MHFKAFMNEMILIWTSVHCQTLGWQFCIIGYGWKLWLGFTIFACRFTFKIWFISNIIRTLSSDWVKKSESVKIESIKVRRKKFMIQIIIVKARSSWFQFFVKSNLHESHSKNISVTRSLICITWFKTMRKGGPGLRVRGLIFFFAQSFQLKSLCSVWKFRL